MASNAAVAALIKPVYQHGRNNFPLDTKQVYSQKAGQITPVKCFHYEPGTNINIKAHDFTMTFPMQTAPFLRGRKEFSFYSVYYNAVWSLFNQYQGTKNDPKTSAFGKSPQLQEPRIKLYDLFGAVYAQWFMFEVCDLIIPTWIDKLAANDIEVSQRREYYIKKAVDYYLASGFDNETAWTSVYTTFTTEVLSPTTYTLSKSLTVFSNLSAYDIGFRDLFDDNGNYYSTAHYCQDVVGHFRAFNWMRKLDMLGYGNLYPFFKDFERMFIEYSENTSLDIDGFFDAIKDIDDKIRYSILEMTATFDGNEESQSNIVYKMANLYPICSYNAIFYHFFRNSFYDLDYDPHDYNLDFVSVDTSHGSYNVVSLDDFSLRFLDIEYHQWKKDTFTGVLPDTQFGAVSSVEIDMGGSVSLSGITGSDASRWSASGVSTFQDLNVSTRPTGSDLTSLRGTINNDSFNLTHTHNVSGTASIQNTSFDVIALKRAEMLQEYRQQLMRAGNKTSDVFKAVYGSAPSSEHEDDVIPRFLETFGEDIFVDPVTATADTGTSNANGSLGDIASRGKFRGDSKTVKFNAGGNFGCILCLSYVVPVAEYNSYMYDKHIFELSPEMHYLPQFENSGLEQILSDELNMLIPANDVQALGFGPRYHHKKSDVDMVHGAFCSVPSSQISFIGEAWYGDFNNWVSPRSDLQNRKTTSIRDFYVNPSVLDNVFVRAAGADQADDQFICNTYFEVNAVKAMSKVGLINFV